MGGTGSRDVDDHRPTPGGGKMTERHCWSRLSRALPRVLLAAACVTASVSDCGGFGLPTLTHAPPPPPAATRPFAYNSFAPSGKQGASYGEPVFCPAGREPTTPPDNDGL